MYKKIAIIGYGSMGKMLTSKILESNVIQENNLFVTNRSEEKLKPLGMQFPQINICNNIEAARKANIIFVCVRPNDMKSVLDEIKDYITEDKHIISLNGSISFEQIEKIIPGNISKVIPSITAEINASQTLVCHNEHVTIKDKNDLNTLLQSFGTVIELPEKEMGMGSELVSCMPGFLAALVKVLSKSALSHTNIDEQQVREMIFNTMLGTSTLVIEKNLSIETLISRVATKGGITEEGTKVIERNFPKLADELFEKTLAKRKLTSETALKAFD